jgi:outer membrane protein OmpA-like peptidoglycan-associated protein
MSESVLKTFVTKWLLLLGLLCSTQAQALDVQLFRPNFDQQGGIVVQNSHTMPKRSFASGVFINWVRNPIEFGLTNDSRTDTLVGWFATVDLLFAYGVTDDLTVGLDMPFNLSSNIEPIGTIFQGASSSIGDLNLFAKYRLLKHQEDRKIIPGIAIIPFVDLPTGDDGVFFGNDKVSGGFKLAMNWRLSDKQDLSFNVGPRFRETDTVLNLSVGNELLGSIGYNHLIWEKHKLNLAVELFGSTTFKNFMSEEITSPLEILVGLRKPWMNERLQTTFGIGRGGTNGYGSPDARIFAGATYFFSGPKQKPDTDSDGIKDHRDTCPNEAEDVDQYQDQDGCPDPDNDKDGILDTADQCPLEPEVINGVKDEDGCPDEGQSKVKIEGSKFVLLDKVYFATNKDEILPKSNDVLNQVVATLKANPEITKLRVEGHTDDRGSDVWNLDLSKRRAKRVREYLVSQGIDSKRIESEGYGETQPIDTNTTAAGRDNNRRVEFNIISQASVTIGESKFTPKAQKKLEKVQSEQMAAEPVAIKSEIVTEKPVTETPIVAVPVQEPKLSKKKLKQLEKERAAELAAIEKNQREQMAAEEATIKAEMVAEKPVIETPIVSAPVDTSIVVEEPKLSKKKRKRLEKIEKEKALTEMTAVKTPVAESIAVKTPAVQAPISAPVVAAPIVETPVAVEEPKLSKKKLKQLEKERAAELATIEKTQREQIAAEEAAIKAEMVAEKPVIETPIVSAPVVVHEPRLTRKELRKLKKAQREQETMSVVVEQPVDPLIQKIEEIMSKVIQFPTNKSRFYRLYIIELNQIVDLLKKSPEIKMMMIEGHADSRGPENYNMSLSERRAEQVRQHFIRSGISPDRLGTLGYGETSPIDTNETPDAWARNRRVEFIITRNAQ